MNSREDAVEIRVFREGDLVALREHVPSPHHPRRAAAHAGGVATFLLAWSGDEPVGYLLLKWTGADEPIVRRSIGGCPEINGVAVAPALRSRGIGTALIREAERRVSGRGIDRVGLAVGVDNARARSLYERLGYRVWDHGSFDVRWPAPDHRSGCESETCVYMLKQLRR